MIEHVGGLTALFSLFLALYLFYGIWQRFCIDYARQHLFEIRDSLFDLASCGEWDFSCNEYKTVRASIEMTIRYAHHLTIWRLMDYALLLGRASSFQRKSDFGEAVKRIENPQLRAKVEEAERDVYRILIWLLVKRSLALILFAVVVKATHTLRSMWRNLMQGAADKMISFSEVGEAGMWQKAQSKRVSHGTA